MHVMQTSLIQTKTIMFNHQLSLTHNKRQEKNPSTLMADNMRTPTYHTFLPTTAEEEEAKRAKNPENQARRIQVEIRKRSPEPFILESNDPNLKTPP